MRNADTTRRATRFETAALACMWAWPTSNAKGRTPLPRCNVTRRIFTPWRFSIQPCLTAPRHNQSLGTERTLSNAANGCQASQNAPFPAARPETACRWTNCPSVVGGEGRPQGVENGLRCHPVAGVSGAAIHSLITPGSSEKFRGFQPQYVSLWHDAARGKRGPFGP
jgi:hypothetical protein